MPSCWGCTLKEHGCHIRSFGERPCKTRLNNAAQLHRTPMHTWKRLDFLQQTSSAKQHPKAAHSDLRQVRVIRRPGWYLNEHSNLALLARCALTVPIGVLDDKLQTSPLWRQP